MTGDMPPFQRALSAGKSIMLARRLAPSCTPYCAKNLLRLDPCITSRASPLGVYGGSWLDAAPEFRCHVFEGLRQPFNNGTTRI
jgi:hypothetical protein